MTLFDSFSFSKKRAVAELGQFKQMLDRHFHTPLVEREHILPFFKTHRQVAALIGSYNISRAPNRWMAHAMAWELGRPEGPQKPSPG